MLASGASFLLNIMPVFTWLCVTTGYPSILWLFICYLPCCKYCIVHFGPQPFPRFKSLNSNFCVRKLMVSPFCWLNHLFFVENYHKALYNGTILSRSITIAITGTIGIIIAIAIIILVSQLLSLFQLITVLPLSASLSLLNQYHYHYNFTITIASLFVLLK